MFFGAIVTSGRSAVCSDLVRRAAPEAVRMGKGVSWAIVIRIALASATAWGLATSLPGEAQAAACVPAGAAAVQVVDAPDAGTIRLADGRSLTLAGVASFARIVDGPQSQERADRALTARLSEYLARGETRAHLLDRRADRYGRLPALLTAGGRLVQEALVAEGLAVAFIDGRAEDCMAALLAAESEARAHGAGFWSHGAAVLAAEPGVLWSHLGRYVIFEGRILSVGNRRQRSYLDFGTRWSRDVTVEIEASDRERLGGVEALERLAGQVIRVRGFVEDSRGPMVRVRWPAQIEIVAPRDGDGSGA
jgi:micrococcal nuclease